MMKINATGIATQYHGASIVSPNQFTLQEVKDSSIVNKTKNKITFFMYPPPFKISITQK
jgi:hypothetical protein